MKSLLEQFRPKTMKDLLGNEKAVKKVQACVIGRRVCLLYGPAGVGKTSTVYAVANDLGHTVREWNASDSRRKEDFVRILREMKSKPFNPTVYLLDEIDGVEDFNGVVECIKNTANPLVLICNNFYKIPPKVAQLCEVLRYYEPRVTEVSEVIRKISLATGMKPDYSKAGRDFRNSILCAFYGGDRYMQQNVFDELEAFFKFGETKNFDENHFVWLIDNGCLQFRGRKLYNFYTLLDTCDRLNNFTPMQMVSGGKAKIEYPRYIKKAKALRRKRKD